MNEKTEVLTTKELNDLKKQLSSNYFTGLVIFIMIYFLYHIIYLAGTGKWLIPRFEMLIFLGFLLFILSITYYLSKELKSEITSGLKIIVFKTIENKRTYMDKQDRLSFVKTIYVIIADNKKYLVSEELYKKAEISDFLLIHKTPIREEELKIEIEKKSHNRVIRT